MMTKILSLNGVFKKMTAMAFSAFLLIGCSQTPQMNMEPTAAREGLQPVENTGLDSAYVDPALDLSRYRSLLIHPLVVDNVAIVQPENFRRRPGGRWELTDKNKEVLQASYRKAIEKYLQEDTGYRLVDKAESDTLVVSTEVIALHPTAPKDDFSSRPASSRFKVISQGAGSITIAIALQDGGSDKLMARLVDTHSDTQWAENNQFNNRREISQAFAAWARQFRQWLDASGPKGRKP